MANTLKIKRGTNATIPQGQLAEPLFTTDTYDLYIGKGSGGNQRIQNYIASGTSSQFLKGDGSLDSTTYQATSEKGQNNGYASLDAGGKIPASQLPSSVIEYKGTWNASTNTPTLADGTGDAGDVYIVSVGGTQNLGSGSITFAAGDWVMYNGAIWQKSTGSNAVASVNGQTGIVVLDTDDISEPVSATNLWFTNARARTAISLTTTGSSGMATYDNMTGVLNVPNYSISGLGGVPTSRQLTINGTAYDLSADRSWSVGTVTSVAALTIGTTGTDITSTVANGTTTPVITLNIPTASATNRGALSSADWSIFNGKQAQLNGTGFVKASGTTISYDNSTYLTTSSASSTYVPYSGANTNVNLGIYGLTAGVHLIANYNDQTPGASASRDVIQANTSFTPSGTTNVKTDWKNFNASFTINTTGTLTNYYGYYATAPTVTSGTITNKYSFYGASGAGIGYFADGITLAGTLSGTTASFSGNVSAARFTPTGSTIPTVGMYSSASNFLDFSTNGTRAITISDGQKVGIGADPISAYRLYVNGDIYASATVYGSSASFVGTGTFGSSVTATNGTFSNGGASSQLILNTSTSSSPTAWTRYNKNGVFKWDIGMNVGGLTSDQFSFYSTSNVLVIQQNGNVGIGTASPQSITNGLSLTIGDSATQHQPYLAFRRNSTGGYWAGINWYDGTTRKSFIEENANFDLRFGTSNALAMIITSGGNVGIGTTSPVVATNQVSVSVNGSVAGRFDVKCGDVHQGQYIATSSDIQFGSVQNIPVLFYSNSTERMRITSGGNLNFNPNNATAYININQGNGLDGGIIFQRSNSNKYQLALTGGDALYIYNYATGSDSMRITSGGNVLIGTTTDGSADSRLSVAGSIITKSYGGSAAVTTSYAVPGGFGGLFVARGYDNASGVAFSVVYHVVTKVPGGAGSDVYSNLISQNGATKTFTFDNNGGFLRITPSANTQWNGTFLAL